MSANHSKQYPSDMFLHHSFKGMEKSFKRTKVNIFLGVGLDRYPKKEGRALEGYSL